VHKGLLAHPTMRTGPPGQFLGRYCSSNGFCACPVLRDISQPQCSVPVTDSSPCSLRSTIWALMATDRAFTDSYVFPVLNNEKARCYCSMQLDWPNVDCTLRDGSPVNGRWEGASGPTKKVCHILDRFHPFQYRYSPAGSLTNTSKTTIHDGACST
jgi:hypothetical protein